MFPEGRALEFLLAAAVALVVVGPKDLPILMRKLGQFLGRMRAMAAEFRASFDEMARQSELDELRKEVEAMRQAQFVDVAAQAGHAEVHDAFTDIQQNLSGIGAEVSGQTAPYYEAPSEPVAGPEASAASTRKPRAQRKPAAAAAKKTSMTKASATKAAATKSAAKTPAKPRARKSAEPKA